MLKQINKLLNLIVTTSVANTYGEECSNDMLIIQLEQLWKTVKSDI